MRSKSFTIFCFGLYIFFLVTNFSNGKGLQKGKPFIIGNSYNLFSKILGEQRTILVSLPEGYENSKESYPVFYLLDGDLQFHNVSGIIEFLSKFRHIPKMILVAIQNVDRERDFLPFQINNWPPEPSAKKFRHFLKEELIPDIDEQFRTTSYRVLAGHSYGGIFCIDSFLREPDVFTAYMAISPAVNWNLTKFKEQWTSVLDKTIYLKKFLYITISFDDKEAIEPTKELVTILRSASPEGLEWKFEYMPNDDHLTTVHPVIFNALKWLHKGWRLSETALESMSLKDVKNHYKKLSEWYGSEVKVHNGILFNLGYILFDQKKKQEAIEVYNYGISIYPESAACYLGLGDILYESGNFEKARINLEKAIRLAEIEHDTMILPVAKSLLKELLKKMK